MAASCMPLSSLDDHAFSDYRRVGLTLHCNCGDKYKHPRMLARYRGSKGINVSTKFYSLPSGLIKIQVILDP